jgi:hypothetical protein
VASSFTELLSHEHASTILAGDSFTVLWNVTWQVYKVMTIVPVVGVSWHKYCLLKLKPPN